MGRLNVHQADHHPQQHQTSTITHFSHIHPLHLTNINNQSPTLNPHNPPCSACKLTISGSNYACHLCNFFLHSKCTQMPQHIKHPFHNNNHVFSLHPVPLYPEGHFNCNACCKQGNGFSYHCPICKVDLHLLCASMPLSSSHHSHHHELRLSFFPPYQSNGFSCDVCNSPGSNSWLYRCDHCSFDVHLDCVTARIENPIVLTQPSRNITMAQPGQTRTRTMPTTTTTPVARPSPGRMNMVTRGLFNGGLNAIGGQVALAMLGGGGMLQGLMGGGGDGGGSGGDVLQGGGDPSSAFGGLDPSSAFGGLDPSSVFGGF